MMEEWMRVGRGEGKNRGEHERLMSSGGRRGWEARCEWGWGVGEGRIRPKRK